jgi:hypothetical protein
MSRNIHRRTIKQSKARTNIGRIIISNQLQKNINQLRTEASQKPRSSIHIQAALLQRIFDTYTAFYFRISECCKGRVGRTTVRSSPRVPWNLYDAKKMILGVATLSKKYWRKKDSLTQLFRKNSYKKNRPSSISRATIHFVGLLPLKKVHLGPVFTHCGFFCICESFVIMYVSVYC